jgi:RNA polymerase sigma-70 factor (ECF subfamily)
LFLVARRLGHSEHDAQDLTQAFFAHFLEKGCIEAADAARGRFRSFLATSFRHFVDGEWRKAHAAKRGGKREFISWEEMSSAAEADVEPADPNSADRVYDQKWARTVFAQAFAGLREEFSAQGKAAQFEQIKRFLSSPATDATYAEAGQPLGMSSKAVAVAVHRMRHRYGELVRAEVANTVSDENELEDEVRYLREVMRG